MKNLFKVFILFGVLVCVLSVSSCMSTTEQSARSFENARQSFVVKDYSTTFRRLKGPARAGDANAQYALGYMYYYGKGVLINQQLAKYWFERAAAQGQPSAKKALKMIAKKKRVEARGK